MASKSKSGSKPSSDSWKPFCPRALPWHAPALQPARVRIGWTSRSNVTGRGVFAFLTVTAIVVEAPLMVAVIVAAPSPSGETMPVGFTRATAGALLE